jgi:excinuclease UvrABC helicase subunit UvrB
MKGDNAIETIKHNNIIFQNNVLLFFFIARKLWQQLTEYYTHQEKKVQAVHNGVDIQDRLPILTQNVQAHIPLQVNIWMVNLTCYQYKILVKQTIY